MDVDLRKIEEEIAISLKQVTSEKQLEDFERFWLGSKGVIKSLFRKLSEMNPDQKVVFAKELNRIKTQLDDLISERKNNFSEVRQKAQLTKEFIDSSLPEKTCSLGNPHPIRLVERKITELIKPFGFKVVEGPEIETEYYCFDALNIPKHHPARDMQDTFYTELGNVLRTHTTSVQSRELEKGKLPVKIISCGRAYRNEADDASHQSMFHQYEMVWVEEGLNLSHLLALITYIFKGLFSEERKVRFVPKYYPYTEPSIGPQIDCLICKGKGCSFCKGSGWVTVGGSGMIHEKVLREFNYDPKKVSGLAFGLGSSRLAAQFYQAPNLKALYTNDMRFLRGVL